MDIENNPIKIYQILKNFSKTLPKFPDGRINYSNSAEALVLTCFVEYQDRILLLQRSNEVGTYQKRWNAVAGYMDEIVPIKKKILEELQEELNISETIIKRIIIGNPYKFYDEEINKTWIIIPCVAKLKQKPKIILDWEHIDYKWIRPNELTKYPIVPNLDISLKNTLN